MDHSLIGPIIACSTGEENVSAIGVIRLSGFSNLLDFQDFFSLRLDFIKPRFSYRCKIMDPKSKEVLDDILFTYFIGPNSYNGENLLEISCHGNPIIIKNILNVFIDFGGVRYAAPGEFTLRALQNKKLSFSQVEGLDLLLNSKSEYGVDQGLKTLCGELHNSYLQLEKLILKLRSTLELGIDFLEDIGEESFLKEKKEAISDLNLFLINLNHRASVDCSALLSPEIILFGPVNAGKSSLFNFLLKTNRSIVSEKKGTTRDFVSEYIKIENIQFKLVDTAGFRETNESVEAEGIARTEKLLGQGFFKILIIDLAMENFENHFLQFEEQGYDLCILSHYDDSRFYKNFASYKHLFKNKKIFCSNLLSPGPIEPRIKTGPIEPSSSFESIGPEELILSPEKLYESISRKYLKLNDLSPIMLPRQRYLINKIYLSFRGFVEMSSNFSDLGLLSNELNLLSSQTQELIGVITSKQVLENLFDNFCIGK